MGNLGGKVSNNEKLDSYFVNDFNLIYTITPKKIFKSITLTALVNNLFNIEYVSNGYYGTWDDDYTTPGTVTTYDWSGYYPQATRNFLVGANFKF